MHRRTSRREHVTAKLPAVLLAGLLAVPLAAPPAHGLAVGGDFAADVGPPAIRSSLTSQPHSDRIAPLDAGGFGGHPTTWRIVMIKVSVMYANTPRARSHRR
jgi:hypothetical protein